ncbi:MAG: hypothetical protein HY701_00905 [Gemmatimonadetes bacterium]|nr:hypothetical protein [Gemmatimonadota bacterium]
MTLYLRNVPAGIVREAKIKAAREGTTLTGVVIEALARSLEAQEGTRFPSEDQLGEDMKWYQENRALLLRRYAGEYVAIVDRAVIDHDEDFESLATRVFSHAGVRSVFMPRVTEARERVRVRSPRRRKS